MNGCDSLVHYELNIISSIVPIFEEIEEVCEGSPPIILPNISLNGIEGVWNSEVNTLTPGITTYTFTPTEGQCVELFTTNIEVKPLLTPVFDSFNSICEGDNTFSLPTISQNGIAGNWSPEFSSDEVGIFEYTFTPNDGECALTANSTLSVNNLPEISMDSLWTVTEGESITLFSEIEGNEPFSYTWQPNNQSLSCFDCQYPEANPLESQDYIFTVLDFNGCESSSEIFIEVLDLLAREIKIPDAFTPNGDNVNDEFKVFGVSFQSMKLSVYNRWGEKLFETTDPNNGWDGTYNGALLKPGVYVYSFTGLLMNGKLVKRMGNVSLLR